MFPCFTTIFLPVIQSPRPHHKRCNPCCAIGSCERTRRRRPAMAQGSHGVCKGGENSRGFQKSNIFWGFPPGKFHIFGTPTMVLVELFLGENDKPKKMMNGRWVTGFTWLDYGQTLQYLERLFGIRWVYHTSNTSAKQYI